MGISVRKLQVVMLVGAGLLVVMTAAFLGYSRYLARRFKMDLPGKLGIDIQQQADGFTYSQSVQGKTVYTIHAARAIQHSNGKWTLHDVGITLYGQKQDRNDHISGSEFEYDQKEGEIHADGEVQIDLSASPTAKRVNSGTQEEHVIHLKTSALSFQEKTHRAVTSKRIDFTSGGYTGHAVGADYNSETGLIVLDAEVVVSGEMDDKPATLHASHAELNQKENIVDLISPDYVTVADADAADPGQERMTARHAVIYTDEDNNPKHIEANGAVTLSATGRGTLVSDRGDAQLGSGRAQTAHLFGHVRYADHDSERDTVGEAQDARMAFDALGRVSQIVVTGDVFAREQVSGSERDLHASRVELAFTATGKQQAILRDMQASGTARLHLAETVSKPKPRQVANTVSDLSGDALIAHFENASGRARLVSVHGAGNTVVHRTDEQGASETSTGKLLDASFEPQASKPKEPATEANKPRSAVQLKEAVQTGGVTILRTTLARPGSPAETQHGAGDRAVYNADSDTAVLTGRAQLSDATGVVLAQRIVLLRESGDATAEGGVRTTYLQATQPNQTTPQEPVHVLADHAVMHRDAGTAIFFGNPARLWQTGTQVEAPVLEFDQNQRTLFAHGESPEATEVVHAVLVPAQSATQTKKPEAKPQGPFRVAATEMTYSDITRQIDFRGAVHAVDADGTMLAQQAAIFLKPANGSAGPKSGPVQAKASAIAVPGGDIDHIVATGKVELRQPGRIASGQQLVYTAADGVFVLTGTREFPPRVIDDVQGTITGESLRFKTGEDSVVVTGTGGTRRVHTETHMKQ